MLYLVLTKTSNDAIVVNNPITIGIIGGGQLGKMIAQEAKRMSLGVIILDPEVKCPASRIADEQIIANFKNEDAINELANKSDVLTYEIELGNSSTLRELESKQYLVYPSSENLKIIQNKYRQKKFLKEHSINTTEFEAIEDLNHLKDMAKRFCIPVILKACEDSYDGRGNYLIKHENEIDNAFNLFATRSMMVEKFVPFEKEISVMVARNKNGEVQSFPVVENIHDEGILDTTIAPARISDEVEIKAKFLAERTVHFLEGIGIFGVEMFVTNQGEVLVNEIAPRPHNSGHYSIEACTVSQFEQHIRAILNLPLSKPELLSHAVMVNILGPKDFTGHYAIRGLTRLFSVPGVKVHVYGKKISSPRRKLGHIVALARSTEKSMARAEVAKKVLQVVRD
jgi:5-(carboxyamino)imidazole ribonucleotide synthase